MAYIEVDHSKFETAASAIDTYVSKTKKNMSNIDSTVCALNSEWAGKDYDTVKTGWNEMKSLNSVPERMLISLKNYADTLRDAGIKYKEAQARAVNRANTLCK